MPKLNQREKLMLYFAAGLIIGKIAIWGGIGIAVGMFIIYELDKHKKKYE